ncbi:glycerol transport system ATP-binding protein [Desulfobaculum xiamenense]|uniref:Glycerol transport system ATP-binding protein n=1 Tax=Desulfobaculum xiamenense TaxID=995050 RepID=A0A846QI76_9BACT|nr:ABC transporter ATP-binding protein [Desulfobaculum xiamenense]NJB68556.1 glycerol transport system ATP-binding protein [Desulfobaculum xiamenense]
MASVQFLNVSHSYDPPGTPDDQRTWAVRDLSVTWEDGSANALLGPSGCGKTTLLNLISGLLPAPTRGKVLVDGRDVTGLGARERGIAQVFQFPVVYDSMNVFDNLAFPLRNEGMAESAVRGRVMEVARILDLSDRLKVPAARLNPADKQKISLGRGIVRESTAAVLLDEPLTVIDPKLKWGLRRKLREVQRALGKTMIYVTHDQHEALTFADDVTVVRDGVLVQKGSPKDLHDDPAAPFIGYFIGSPGMNVLACTLDDAGLDCGAFTVPLSPGLRGAASRATGALELGIRPEFVEAYPSAEEDSIPFTVTVVEDTGAYRILTLVTGDARIKARVAENFAAGEGETVGVRFPQAGIKLFAGGRRLV